MHLLVDLILLFLLAFGGFLTEACITYKPSSAPGSNLSPEEYNQLGVAQTKAPSYQGLNNDGSQECGHNKYWNTGQGRILGGVTALQNEFPWLVRLLIKGNTLCGATIVSNKWLLTAAHCCVLSTRPSDFLAYFADHQFSKTDQGEFTMNPYRIIPHPSYSPTSMDYDFCLLEVPRTLDFSTWSVQPACLPDSCDDECDAGEMGFVAGWGTMEEGSGQPAITLQKAKMPIVDRYKCAPSYANTRQPINDVKMCTGYDEGEVDTCQGDSGGPLTCAKNGYHMLMGVTSYGQGCGRAGYFGVYARVCRVLDWIFDVDGSTRSIRVSNATKTQSGQRSLPSSRSNDLPAADEERSTPRIRSSTTKMTTTSEDDEETRSTRKITRRTNAWVWDRTNPATTTSKPLSTPAFRTAVTQRQRSSSLNNENVMYFEDADQRSP